MKPVLLIAVVSAMILGVYEYLRPDAPSDSASVILAGHDLAPGTVIRMIDLRVVVVDLAQLPKETPRHFRDVVGHAVIVPIAQGQMILPSQVSPDAIERPPTRASVNSDR